MKMNKKKLRSLIRECLTEMFDDPEPIDAERKQILDSFDDFTNSYVAAAMATSMDNRKPNGGDPLDKNYTVNDFHTDPLERMKKDCEDFQKRFSQYLEKLGIDDGEAGTMFWLSRNGHGTGFWDVRDWKNEYAEAWGDLLHKAAKSYGPYDLYFADSGRWDGLIFGYPA
jgi:hypothetical protein